MNETAGQPSSNTFLFRSIQQAFLMHTQNLENTWTMGSGWYLQVGTRYSLYTRSIQNWRLVSFGALITIHACALAVRSTCFRTSWPLALASSNGEGTFDFLSRVPTCLFRVDHHWQ